MGTGELHPRCRAWKYLFENLEVYVPGNFHEPIAIWLRIARESMGAINRYHADACTYLDRLVDQKQLANGSDWELEWIKFGGYDERQCIRLTLFYNNSGDPYGLWSVAFQATGLPQPNDLQPVRFSRQQL